VPVSSRPPPSPLGQGLAPRPSGPSAPRSRWAGAGAALALALGAAAAITLLARAPSDRPAGVSLEASEPSAPPEVGSGAPEPAAAPTAAIARCDRPELRLRVGAASPPPDAGEEEAIEPFAAEVGRACRPGSGGWAIGAKRDADGAGSGELGLLAAEGGAARLVALGRLRGDVDPPIVACPAAWSDAVLAGLLEPNASGYTLRLARVPTAEGAAVVWGAEIEQSRDDSLATDLGAQGDDAVVVWDHVAAAREPSAVMLATVPLGKLDRAGEPRRVSAAGVDADQPRLALREGGFWLAYVARAPAPARVTAPPASAAPSAAPTDDGPARYPAERLERSWIEVVPLDARGEPLGEPRPVTPRDGYVLAFDVGAGPSGALHLAWRDDDTPSGGGGGRVEIGRLDASGGFVTQRVADRDVGAGAPALVAGWLALSDPDGRLRLAPRSDTGELGGEPRLEPLLGRAELLGADGERLLIASQVGRAVELAVTRCRGER
jgi:hypothetical protein